MKEFVEKLIGRLEEYKYSHLIERNSEQCEHCKYIEDCENRDCSLCIWDKSIEIVNQLAEEHKDDIQTIDVSELLGESVNDGWIPCSERLPDDFMSMEYLTTVKGRFYSEINYYCVVNHKWYSNERTTKEVNVIAWMPKPTVYQPKGE